MLGDFHPTLYSTNYIAGRITPEVKNFFSLVQKLRTANPSLSEPVKLTEKYQQIMKRRALRRLLT